MKNTHSESDTRAIYIDPQLKNSGWKNEHIVREYYFTDGRKLFGNTRGKRLFLDYLLKFNNMNLAIIEAKRESEHPKKGMQQAIDYAKKVKVIDIKTRKERAVKVRDDNKFFTVYSNLKAREFLEFVLENYEKYGIEELQRDKLGDLVKLKLGTSKDAKDVFGNMNNLLDAYYKLQENIYKVG
jgi:type I site-specific restriction endonuclease